MSAEYAPVPRILQYPVAKKRPPPNGRPKSWENALKGKDFIPGCREICNRFSTFVRIFLETARKLDDSPSGNSVRAGRKHLL
jgi:hypothetical protein